MIHGFLFALRHPVRFVFVNLLALTMRPGVSYYHTERWQKIREYVSERDGNRCRARGCKVTRGLDTHHKRPVSQGGSWFTWNLVKLCQAHHALRHPKNTHLQDRARNFRH